MIRILPALILSALVALPAPAAAQEETDERSPCLMGGLSFTEGASLRSGFETVVCRASGKWVGVEDAGASLCIYNTQGYSLGSILRIGEDIFLRCSQSGSWSVNE